MGELFNIYSQVEKRFGMLCTYRQWVTHFMYEIALIAKTFCYDYCFRHYSISVGEKSKGAQRILVDEVNKYEVNKMSLNFLFVELSFAGLMGYILFFP